jgi:hypothetical protein
MQGYSPVSNPGYQPPYQQGGYPQAPGGYVQAPGGYPQAPGGYGSNPYQAQGYANQPMPPTAMPPVHFAGITYTYVLDPMQELALSPSVLIRQQPQFFEQISGCESPNRYFVFSQSPQTGFKMLFKCKEQSECCQRNCCSASMREFVMDIKHIANAGALNENFQNSFVHVNKPFKCTCCCLERPEMIANYSANGELVGKVKQPFSCCDPIFTIYDNAGTMRYYIYADCCQCGLCCSGPCAKMSEVTFNIYRDANMGQPIGSIVKKIANFSELITSADSYQVNFPADARPNEKLLLIITGLMIDYQFFEERAGNDDNTGRTY